MSSPRRYSRATLMGLVALSRGTCYWPDPPCGTPVVARVNGQPVLNLQIAHIHAAHKDGPRYAETMTDDQRRDFSNLILLCTPHHVYVDKIKPGNFPPELLVQWKTRAEQDGIDALGAVSGLTEANLAENMVLAIRQANDELQESIEQLRELSPVAADLLQAAGATDELMLVSRHLRNLPAGAEALYLAARMLPPNLADTAGQLMSAAKQLQGLSGAVETLGVYLDQIKRLRGDW